MLFVKTFDVQALEDPRRKVLKARDDGQEALDINTLVVEEIEGAVKGTSASKLLAPLTSRKQPTFGVARLA